MRRPYILLYAGIIALCTACAANPGATAAAQSPSVVELRAHRIDVEVASDDASRAHGLMDRVSMPADHGMLFVFPDSAVRTFWMKDTLIPLDMLFIDDQRRIVTLLHDVPPCKTDPCPVYPSTAPARYVLEINAGAATSLGARVGDTMKFDDVSIVAQ